MHLLFFVEFYRPHMGGADTVFEHIVQGLLAKGHRITLITTKFQKDLQDIEGDNNFTLYRVGSNRFNFMRFALLKAHTILKDQKDISHIYTGTFTGAVPARITAWLRQRPVMITVHEIFGHLRYVYKGKYLGYFWQYAEYLLLHRGFDMYHCVSYYTYNSLRLHLGISDAKMRMIHLGVDQDIWKQSLLDQKIIQQIRKIYMLQDKVVGMYFGHTGISKGLDFLLDALPIIQKKIPNFVLFLNVIHDINYKRIEKKLERLGVKDMVIPFHGMIKKELIHKVATADFVIMPSLSEGFGLVAAEVCSLGKPLIVSQVAALPEVVFGRVVWTKPGDVQSIANAIIDVSQCIIDNNIEAIPTIATKVFPRDSMVDSIEESLLSLSS